MNNRSVILKNLKIYLGTDAVLVKAPHFKRDALIVGQRLARAEAKLEWKQGGSMDQKDLEARKEEASSMKKEFSRDRDPNQQSANFKQSDQPDQPNSARRYRRTWFDAFAG